MEPVIVANVPVVDPPAAVAQPTATPAPTPDAAVAQPTPTPAPLPDAAVALTSPTPLPTLSGTMPPATIPPTPSVPPPVMPTPVPATQFARVVNYAWNPLRSYPSTTASILTSVPHGQIAGLFSITSNGYWYKATYRGHVGYLLVSRMQRIPLVGQTYAAMYSRVIVVGRVSQQIEVYQNQKLMLISAVTTGRPDLPTLLGTTKIAQKQSPHLFVSPWAWPSFYWYPPGWADYALLFRSGGYYFHDTHYRPENGFGIGTNYYHRDPDGVWRYGSRGCVNTPFWAVQRLYGWGVVGDVVVVIDK